MAWFLVQGYMINHEGGSPPGFGGGWGGGPRPDHGLPGGGPVDPGFGGGMRPPVDPGYGRPGWSPVDPGWGGGGMHPGMPGFGGGWGSGGRPDNSLPGQPIDPGFGGGIGQQPGHPSGQPIIPGATPHGTAVATQPPEKVDPENGLWVLVNVQGSMVWAWAQKNKGQDAAPPAGTKPITPPPAQPKT
jgi:hypothetical protein